MNKNINEDLLNHFNNYGTIFFITKYRPNLLNDNNKIVRLLSVSNMLNIQRLDKKDTIAELGDELILASYLDKSFKQQFQNIWLSNKQVEMLLELISDLHHSLEKYNLHDNYLEFIEKQ